MTNELIFFFHLGLLLLATLYALRLGSMALTLLIGVEALLANLFVLKEVTLFGFSATSTDVFAVASLYGLNLLREFYGKDAARTAANLSIGVLLLFAFLSGIHLWYQPSAFDQTDAAFQAVLSSSPRIFLASLTVYALVQRFDLWVFGKMLHTWPFGVRIGVALFLSETIDTVLFTFVGLYGLMPSLGSILCVSLGIKWLAIGCSALFTRMVRRAV